ncbi:hypothetical protein GCM10023093_21360 [Nemorincola caseinilytica]|uniref:histidine kinase n=1 Tax=Nemorincola caseinilytica TaxID=2054315 RepID=A0ABP8NG71_9BACT
MKELSSDTYRDARDTGKVSLLCNVARAYLQLSKEDSVIFYAGQGLQLAQDIDHRYGQGICLATLGGIEGNFEYQLDHLLRALKIFEQINDKYQTARTYDVMAGVYFNMKNFTRAMEYFRKAYDLYAKIHDKYDLSRTLTNIGECYAILGDLNKAIECQRTALKYYEEIGDGRKVATALGNIGNCYHSLHDIGNALAYAHKAVRIFSSIADDNYNYAIALRDLGRIYLDAANDSSGVTLADSLLPAGRAARLAKAIYYFRGSHAVYDRNPVFLPIDISLGLAQALEASGHHLEALRYYKEHMQYKDSMLSEDIHLKVATLETQREADLKEQQIELNRIQAANEKKERALFLISIALLGVIILLIGRNYARQRGANVRLLAEKAKLETANKQIAEEKQRSDDMAVHLQESLVQKESLASQLTHAASMKSRFLANISHELRTPVTLLTGMLDLMRTGGKVQNPRIGEQLDIAYSNSRRLQYMVEEILDLSRLETTNSRLNLEIKDIVPVLRRMVYAFETFIENERLILSFTSDRATGIYVQVDELMLEKVINNLVYNAVKFNTPGGWIKVVTAIAGNDLVFVISNSGSGIRQQDLPHVFERYYQADTNTAKAQGIGIGLSLVKEFTVLMGGTVYVDSSEEGGTTFTLQFPIAEKVSSRADIPREPMVVPGEKWEHFSAKQTVLIAEDNVEMRYYLRQVLGDKVDLIEAANGREALDKMADTRVDLVITDLMMPQMGGEELITNLKKTPAYRHIPVITLTALAEGATKIALLRLGIDDHIVKPFDASELRARVYNLLTNLRERRQFESVPSEPDDIPLESNEAETFKERISEFVLARMKTIDVSVYDLAYELGMSERQLYRFAKRVTGCTPAQLIKEVRLQKAYELLVSGSVHKVEYAAKQVGFDDASYFSRQFYERFGKRPADFL